MNKRLKRLTSIVLCAAMLVDVEAVQNVYNISK